MRCFPVLVLLFFRALRRRLCSISIPQHAVDSVRISDCSRVEPHRHSLPVAAANAENMSPHSARRYAPSPGACWYLVPREAHMKVSPSDFQDSALKYLLFRPYLAPTSAKYASKVLPVQKTLNLGALLRFNEKVKNSHGQFSRATFRNPPLKYPLYRETPIRASRALLRDLFLGASTLRSSRSLCILSESALCAAVALTPVLAYSFC